MAANQEKDAYVVGQFNAKCGGGFEFSHDRRVASGNRFGAFAFSNVSIPIGLQFSVKILQNSLFMLGIGVTTKDPESGPLPQQWYDIDSSDQYWYVYIRSVDCAAWHKGQKRVLQWDLDGSAGNTFGCCVLQTGELHLYNNGRDVGVALKGLPTDQPLWGFVTIPGGWKVEANYVIPKVSERPSSPCPPIGPAPTSTQPKKVGASSTAQDILDNYRDRFIECVDAMKVVYELRHKKTISDGDLMMIERNLDTKQQNEILHARLERSCDEEALMEVCDMMIAVDGNRRMNALGREMKGELEKGNEGAGCVP